MNTYGNVQTLKRLLDIEATNSDHHTELLMYLNSASRFIDEYCARIFSVLQDTRYYDGAGDTLWLGDDDILAITTLKLDEDGDGTYEKTMATTDYHLIPYNEVVKQWIEINANGAYGAFAGGVKKGVEIAGTFGYGNGLSLTPYYDSGVKLTITIGVTSATVLAEGTLAAGHTVLIESEQMFIETYTVDGSKGITMIRGVNGTTAAAHTAQTTQIYQYPDPITTACYAQAMRWWKRKDSAFQDAVGIPEFGITVVYKGLDSDIKMALEQYRRKGIA